jgi:glycosyltransferase involved in cell wall biosynthesis
MINPTRILHICLRYPPATGGVETYVQQIVERTRNLAAGRDVRVLTSKLRTHGPAEELSPESLLVDQPYIQRLGYNATPRLAYPRLQALPYYISHHNPDIIEAYSFWYQPADVAARYAKKHHKPFIFHPMFYTNANRQKPIWQLYKKFIGKKTFAAADVVVVISPQEQALIEKEGFPVKRFALIPPGIDTDQFATPHLNPFIKKGLKGNILLSVGRLASGKKLADAIAVMPTILKHFPETHLVFIGEDFGSLKELQQQVKDLHLTENIHFWGKVPANELTAAYQHATLLLHTSEYEAFGITLAESLAAGVPVVARHVGAVPFVVPPQEAGLLFTTPNQMESHILTLLADPTMRKRLGRFGEQYIKANFTWEQSIKKLTALYDEFKKYE